MATLEQAIALAAQQHAGQVDKANVPYILHPLRVMLNVPTIEHKIVAVLHDVLEDTETSTEDLRKLGFPQQVIDAVLALTKKTGESRLQAAQQPARSLSRPEPGVGHQVRRWQGHEDRRTLRGPDAGV